MKSTLILFTVIGSTIGFAPVQTTSRQSTSLDFFGGAKRNTVKSSPLADEAVEIYTTKYLSGGGTRQKFFFESWGMPESYKAPDEPESIFSRRVADLTASFNTIALLYGEEEALKMVKIQPGVLAFNKDNFGPSLDAFGENFGVEESKEMIIRNPGLLAVKPANARTADDLTMQLSYVVDFTRPIGLYGPGLILSLLSIPALEGVTGVSRGELLSSLF
mmetsp:Transcript_7104/g.12429  ORF Transcript_7104/g.12429 Transcript_7104/m.12429 type:complete len:218 (+) Transcript_7104:47-700(+)|eukprot:CAMPEP_0201870612 /NCGR_PEP_ID=MMETSP0902-20130614/3696_1 /ASSEMBLY_ACC=CAM_ASM_000551 /TAXON_ID=420261 /ORGANISM="Thalassiosira antarctica, Strain CCMP982" /LENGTH=217 /DNA_ID=CAMNT_0048396297 /DNA_START=26 /DNA_END=679 /DNA_ORIENTATION=-